MSSQKGHQDDLTVNIYSKDRLRAQGLFSLQDRRFLGGPNSGLLMPAAERTEKMKPGFLLRYKIVRTKDDGLNSVLSRLEAGGWVS